MLLGTCMGYRGDHSFFITGDIPLDAHRISTEQQFRWRVSGQGTTMIYSLIFIYHQFDSSIIHATYYSTGIYQAPLQ